MSTKTTEQLVSNFNLFDFFSRSDLMRWDTLIDTTNPSITFYGIAVPGTAESAASWFIWRVVVNGLIEKLEHPTDGDAFLYEWDLRTTYFDPASFSNTFSIQFDGINDFLSVSDDASLSLNSGVPFSYAWWQKTTDGTAYTVLEKAISNQGIRIYKLGNERIEVSWRATGTGDRIRVNTSAAPPNILSGSWTHYAVTFDGVDAAGMQIYENGVPLGMNVLNDTLAGDPTNVGVLAIGSRTNGSDNFAGNMDEVSFWSSQLSAAEVVALYGGGSPQFPISQDSGAYVSSATLVSWWRMGDILGDVFPTINDAVGSNNAIMTNMVAGDIETEAP